MMTLNIYIIFTLNIIKIVYIVYNCIEILLKYNEYELSTVSLLYTATNAISVKKTCKLQTATFL